MPRYTYISFDVNGYFEIQKKPRRRGALYERHQNKLTLASLELRVLFINNENPAFTTNNFAVLIAVFLGF